MRGIRMKLAVSVPKAIDERPMRGMEVAGDQQNRTICTEEVSIAYG